MGTTVIANSNADFMATLFNTPGLHITGATLTAQNTGTGFFSETANELDGLGGGIVLTTGALTCAGGLSNTRGDCTGSDFANRGTESSLQISFTVDSNEISIPYVFGSEEYQGTFPLSFDPLGYDDDFSIVLSGTNYDAVNIAQLPGGAGDISVYNINAATNAAFYRSNAPICDFGCVLPYASELDGLTSLLTASADNLVPGDSYTLTFAVRDDVDARYDSAAFVGRLQLGALVAPAAEAPEPETWAMMLLGFGAIGVALRRRGLEGRGIGCGRTGRRGAL